MDGACLLAKKAAGQTIRVDVRRSPPGRPSAAPRSPSGRGRENPYPPRDRAPAALTERHYLLLVLGREPVAVTVGCLPSGHPPGAAPLILDVRQIGSTPSEVPTALGPSQPTGEPLRAGPWPGVSLLPIVTRVARRLRQRVAFAEHEGPACPRKIPAHGAYPRGTQLGPAMAFGKLNLSSRSQRGHVVLADEARLSAVLTAHGIRETRVVCSASWGRAAAKPHAAQTCSW